MKLTLPSLIAAALLAGLFYEPKPALAQSKEYVAIGMLQRDIADLTRKIEEQKSGQAERLAQTETLIKQLMDANAALASQLKALQDMVSKNQADQERRVFTPLERMKNDVEELSKGFASVDVNLQGVRRQQDEAKKVSDNIDSTVKLIFKWTEQAATQAAPVSTAAPSTGDAAAILFASGQSEKLEGKLDFALATFGDISAKYPDSPFAPKAVFEIGSIYSQNEQYTDALKAFDRVLEQFPDNPMRKDAQFKKAEQLASLGRRPDAAREYLSFARQYPGDDKAAEARDRAKDLTAAPPAAAPKGKQPKSKGR
jgi:TolA-binding protein